MYRALKWIGEFARKYPGFVLIIVGFWAALTSFVLEVRLSDLRQTAGPRGLFDVGLLSVAALPGAQIIFLAMDIGGAILAILGIVMVAPPLRR
jgi:hypothetical protein